MNIKYSSGIGADYTFFSGDSHGNSADYTPLMIRFHRAARMKDALRFTPILVLMLFFSACGVQRSTRYYWPTVAQTFPPKSPTTRLPILNKPPKQPYVVIGTMSFDCKPDEMNDLYKILQYNARRHGADAIIMKMIRFGTYDAQVLSIEAQMIVFR